METDAGAVDGIVVAGSPAHDNDDDDAEDDDDNVVLPFIKNSLLSSYNSGNECVSGLLTMYNKWSLFKSLRYSSIVKFP